MAQTLWTGAVYRSQENQTIVIFVPQTVGEWY